MTFQTTSLWLNLSKHSLRQNKTKLSYTKNSQVTFNQPYTIMNGDFDELI